MRILLLFFIIQRSLITWGQVIILDIREGLMGQSLENSLLLITNTKTTSVDSIYLSNQSTYLFNFPETDIEYQIIISHHSGKYKPRNFTIENHYRTKQTIYLYPTNEFEKAFIEQQKNEKLISQEKNKVSLNEKMPYSDTMETEAMFVGGSIKMLDFISQAIIYPIEVYKHPMSGRAVVQFVVEKDGSVSNIRLARGSGFELLDDEAKRVVRSMPTWSPAIDINGNRRTSFFSLPITFK
ncbi:energy transducer TonB [Crocinitomicaceae bacterium CZZ-1]|uniref:Energy transducer TonB n=1 Tax=Taishania pollutisoli TaxID=2766479 RepID=A0A8J6TTH6_9FLAO|nr:energy transducer TonB [Taishania pollutisoli]MBC9812849.1 energy transducer TonB [Taishania pollutisoli]